MRTRIVGIVAAAMLIGGLGVKAEEPQGWKFEVTPYLWTCGLEGEATVHGRTAEFDKKFGDLFEALDVGGSLLTIVQYDRYLLWAQVDYFSLSTDELDVQDQPEGGSMDTKTLLAELAVGYQLDGWAEGQTFDVLLGVRSMSIENELTIDDVGTGSSEQNLVDPILILRPSIPVFPSKIKGLRFNPTLGIGAGGDSELVYELQPQFQYQITENMVARLGYRRVGYKLESDTEDGNELDLAMAGLIVGLGVTF